MLLNAKPEELIKYSKGTYDKELFIQSLKSKWELTDKQIRMTFLIADLALKAQGVFSVSNEKFREMFEARFKMTISRSTVIRFFQLLEELGLLSVNEARRKNRQQSANIFIIDSVATTQETKVLNESPDETPYESVHETPDEIHNIAFNNTFNKAINTPLNKNVNNVVNNASEEKIEIVDTLTDEFVELGLNEDVIFRVIKEVESTPNVRNFGSYLRTCLTNTLYKVELKTGKINGPYMLSEQPVRNQSVFYDWLTEREEIQQVVGYNKKFKLTNHALFYDWLNA